MKEYKPILVFYINCDRLSRAQSEEQLLKIKNMFDNLNEMDKIYLFVKNQETKIELLNPNCVENPEEFENKFRKLEEKINDIYSSKLDMKKKKKLKNETIFNIKYKFWT